MIDIDLLDAELNSLFGRDVASEGRPVTPRAEPRPAPRLDVGWERRPDDRPPAAARQASPSATARRPDRITPRHAPRPAEPPASQSVPPAWRPVGGRAPAAAEPLAPTPAPTRAARRAAPAQPVAVAAPPATPAQPKPTSSSPALTVPPRDLREAAAWDTMRSLLDGKRTEARAALETMAAVARNADDPATWDRYWTQRFWVGLEWGQVDEQYALLDHCRERAYRFNDLAWRGALTVLLARLGRADEAAREFDSAVAQFNRAQIDEETRLDVLTDLAEAAFRLDDAPRASLLRPALAVAAEPVVLLSRSWVCKGAFARYQGLVAAATRNWPLADQQLRLAVETHRQLGAGPLLARTLQEWGTTLIGRDDTLAHHCLGESATLATRLELVDVPAAASAA